MTYAARAQASIHRLSQHFSDNATLTLRRNHTLVNQRSGAAVTTLAVRGLTSAGASLINLDGPNLKGVLPVGITYTIAGDGTTYTVATANVRADQDTGRLDSVAFTPVLAAEAADDAVVTLATDYKEYTFACARRHFFADEVTDQIAQNDWRFMVSSVGAAVEIDLETDALEFDGQPLGVISLEPFEPGTERAGYIIAAAA